MLKIAQSGCTPAKVPFPDTGRLATEKPPIKACDNCSALNRTAARSVPEAGQSVPLCLSSSPLCTPALASQVRAGRTRGYWGSFILNTWMSFKSNSQTTEMRQGETALPEQNSEAHPAAVCPGKEVTFIALGQGLERIQQDLSFPSLSQSLLSLTLPFYLLFLYPLFFCPSLLFFSLSLFALINNLLLAWLVYRT